MCNVTKGTFALSNRNRNRERKVEANAGGCKQRAKCAFQRLLYHRRALKRCMMNSSVYIFMLIYWGCVISMLLSSGYCSIFYFFLCRSVSSPWSQSRLNAADLCVLLLLLPPSSFTRPIKRQCQAISTSISQTPWVTCVAKRCPALPLPRKSRFAPCGSLFAPFLRSTELHCRTLNKWLI